MRASLRMLGVGADGEHGVGLPSYTGDCAPVVTGWDWSECAGEEIRASDRRRDKVRPLPNFRLEKQSSRSVQPILRVRKIRGSDASGEELS